MGHVLNLANTLVIRIPRTLPTLSLHPHRILLPGNEATSALSAGWRHEARLGDGVSRFLGSRY